MTRYRPEGGKIVGEGLAERYYSNRAVYEGHISAYFMAEIPNSGSESVSIGLHQDFG